VVTTLRFIAGLAHLIDPWSPLPVKHGRVIDKTEALGDLASRYILGKGSPFMQAVLVAATGHNFNKSLISSEADRTNPYQKLVSRWRLLAGIVMPIPVQETFNNFNSGMEKVREGMVSTGMDKSQADILISSIIYGALTGFTGMRVGEAPAEKTPFQRGLTKAIQEKHPNLTKGAAILKASQDVRQGNVKSLLEGVNKGEFGRSDIKNIIKKAQPPIIQELNNAPIEALVKNFPLANNKEKTLALTFIIKKFVNIRERWNNLSRQQRDHYKQVETEFLNELKKERSLTPKTK